MMVVAMLHQPPDSQKSLVLFKHCAPPIGSIALGLVCTWDHGYRDRVVVRGRRHCFCLCQNWISPVRNVEVTERLLSVAIKVKEKNKTPRNLPVLFSRCLIKDFEARPSVTHLLEHPFIKQAHGKEAALRQQLAALIREQQQEAGCRTKTRYIFSFNYQKITARGATGEQCCIRGAAASVAVVFFVQQGAGCPALLPKRRADCETWLNGHCNV